MILPIVQTVRISLIKTDVESAVYPVMQCGRKRIAEDKPGIIIEHGLGGADFYGKGTKDVFRLLPGECWLRYLGPSEFVPWLQFQQSHEQILTSDTMNIFGKDELIQELINVFEKHE